MIDTVLHSICFFLEFSFQFFIFFFQIFMFTSSPGMSINTEVYITVQLTSTVFLAPVLVAYTNQVQEFVTLICTHRKITFMKTILLESLILCLKLNNYFKINYLSSLVFKSCASCGRVFSLGFFCLPSFEFLQEDKSERHNQ